MSKQNPETALMLQADFGEVYTKVYEGRFMKPVKASIALSERKGHLYSFHDKTYISSLGYTILNKVASISIVTPKSVVVDGREEPNPYVERSKTTRAIEAVATRKIGIGFSPLGNITVIDKTLYYNVYTYLIQSIQAKMKKQAKEAKGTKFAIIGTQADRPKAGKWVFLETAPPLGIWINYEHKQIKDCLEEHTRMQRFGERIAQKICERNILRDHPAIGVSRVEAKNGVARVTVYGWRHELGPSQIEDVMAQAEAGSQEIEVKKEVIEPKPEEVKEALEEEAAQEKEAPLFHKEEAEK